MPRPLLSLCMIVKNEEDNLARCLESVKGIVDEIVIVDTGSSDETVEIAKSFGANVYYSKWQDDFSKPRNLSIDKASGKWILILDADEELASETKAHIRATLEKDDCEGFNWKIKNFYEGAVPTYEMGLCFRVFKNLPAYRYNGDIHEQMTNSIFRHKPAALITTEDILINHYGYQKEQVRKKNKKARNLRILLKQSENPAAIPNNSFFNFNIGMEYYRQAKTQKALEHFLAAKENLPKDSSYEPKLDRYLIFCLQKMKRSQKALAMIEDSLRKYPDFVDLYFIRGTINFSKAKYSKAILDFCKCLEIKEVPEWYCSVNGLNTFRAYYYLGLIFEKQMDYTQALLGFQKAVMAESQFTPALQAIIRVFKTQGKSPAEISEYLKSTFNFTKASPLLLWNLLFFSGLYEEAWKLLPHKTKEFNALLNYCFGINLLKLKQVDKALYYFNRDDGSDNSLLGPLTVNKCLCYWLRGDLARAATLLPRLRKLDINPEIKITYPNFHRLLEGNEDLALNIPKRKICIYNHNVFNLVEALMEADQIDKAELATKLLLEQKNVNHNYKYIELLIKNNYLTLAERSIKHRFQGDKEKALSLLVALAEQRKNYQEALEHLKELIALKPKNEKLYLRFSHLVELESRKLLKKEQ